MKHNNKRYLMGLFIIILQYLIFRQISNAVRINVNLRNVSYFLFIFLYFSEDIYSFKTYLVWDELKKQLKCYYEYLIIMSVITYHVEGIDNVWKYFVIGTIGLITSFIIVKLIRKIFYQKMKSNLVIVGTGETAKELKRIVELNNFTMYNFIGFLDVDKVFAEKKEVSQDEILGSYDSVNLENINEVIIALPEINDREMNKIVNKIEAKVKKIKFVPRINKMYTFNPKIQDYDGVLLISTKNNMFSRKRRIIKRLMDIMGGLAGLILLGPLYLIYGRKIKADGGPATFSHNRIGRDLKPFKMHKFRSMYIDAEARLEKMLAEDEKVREEFYTNFKLKEDPRITPVGNFLRRTSLDEFPQFLNVLKGEMSLVGPRPVVQKEVDMYYGTEMGRKVFQAKPGITGMWQANGRSDIEDYDERIALDLYYIRNWSVWLDVIILIKTVKNVLQKKGAY